MRIINLNLYEEFFKSELGKKFVNLLMVDGKKVIAKKILLICLFLIKTSEKKDPILILKNALNNVTPGVNVRHAIIKRTKFQIPVPLKKTKRMATGIKWIVDASKQKSKKAPIYVKLKEEILAANVKQGLGFKKKKSIHQLANSNRAFSHYRWF